MSFVLDTADTGGSFTPVPPGIHLSTCLYVVDIGVQSGSFGPKPMLMFTFEVPGLTAPDGKPMTITRRFGKTLNEKGQLRPFLTSWLGAPLTGQLDLGQFAGKPAQLVVSQSQNGEKVYSNITACAPVAAGTPVPPPSTFPMVYGPNRDPAVFAALPEWIRKAITTGGAAPVGVAAAPTFAAPAPAYPAQPAVQPAYQAPAAIQPHAVPHMQTAQPITPEAPFNDPLSF